MGIEKCVFAFWCANLSVYNLIPIRLPIPITAPVEDTRYLLRKWIKS